MRIHNLLLNLLPALLAFNSQAALPHPDDLSKQGEHLAMLAIVPESQASNVAVTSGNWSSPSTWGGDAPAAGARILIPQGITVTVDAVLPSAFKWIRINGTLDFAATVNTLVKVETIVVDPVGTLTMGTPAQPIAANVSARVIFANLGELDRNVDPAGLGRGLLCHGIARIVGTPTTSYAYVSQAPRKGEMVVRLETAPVNWAIGGRIVIPSVKWVQESSGNLASDDDELLTIVGISGTTVTVNRPLNYDHVPQQEIPLPVAYLDRNVSLQSESTTVSLRAHSMFMHNPNVQIADALFENLGRTDATREVTDPQMDANGQLIPSTTGNDRGRYALHFHRCVPDPAKQATVTRVAIVNSPKLGVVNHDSNILVQDCVAYDVAGSAFFTEIGTEIGAFRRNVAIHTIRGVGDTETRFSNHLPGGSDFGFNGVGFWFQGGGVEATDNMAFHCRNDGFTIFPVGLIIDGQQVRFSSANLENPAWAGGAATVGVNQVTFKKFSGNTTVASGRGFTIRKHDPIGRATVIENSKIVNVTEVGIIAEYGGPVTYKDMLIQGGAPWTNKTGNVGFITNFNNRGLTLDNVTIKNFNKGVIWGNNGEGYRNYIMNSTLDNIINLDIYSSPDPNGRTDMTNVVLARNTPVWPYNPTYAAYHDAFVTNSYNASTVVFNGRTLAFAPNGNITPIEYNLTSATPAPVLQSAVSRMVHGAAGTFDLPLTLTGTPGLEDRRTNGAFQIVLTFDKTISSGSASVTGGVGSIASTSLSGSTMTVNLVGVADRQTLTVGVSNVTATNGGVLASASVPIALLFGDVDATRTVNVVDIAKVKFTTSAGTVNASNVRVDLNADGVINIVDVAIAKAFSGAAL
jgi:hypothetical protein